MSSPSSPGPWWSRLALSPRAAVVLAAVVVVVAVLVVLVGALVSGGGEGAGGTGGVVVRGAPTAGAASGGPSPSAGASAGAAPSAPGAGRVVVHVLGAVRRGGVVELPASSRVGDALERAGGATDDADLDRLNLARVLTDGERLYVPRVGQQEVPEALGPVADGAAAGPTAGAGGGGGTAGTGVEGSAVVDLNTADQTALETLPGIGPGLAGRIIAWRDEHGRFTAVEDLLDVSGIGDVRFAELRDRVRV
ncbi:ComEA family DNA-binding protein [Curtobacterium flaccumfaciens]|uniref:ComEA family DNA-binding protein n=1 Tax=Curtobacterium flaccumfaciens TaxID=2035 RepID=UPI000FFED593|nr:ComEA family DNA-binding protein [Curtobacterium flaccumfaciens]MCS0646531.1 ComEA family DNA-binding protein [Curtobacterium flaccumfaciens pv. flaccumfaciens]MCS6526094.1 ComEA family DNA-binding protein [Curtobacterium flaccumfaciens pv. flaccumfaciens]MCS6528551.1 ComEA family DNA-binding protein [Curtobacterium flaccumfaciens pv. flaccumfaciens]NUU11538.1 ComEA family DNA-binding protein [Curtobacterium flaccumfaciens]RXF85418.1 competence protein ComEA [Curtobacterium flaccumfaciens p